MSDLLFCCLAAVSFVVSADPSKVIGTRAQHQSASGLRGSGLQMPDLLQELERVGGHDQRAATEQRVGRLEEALRPMFNAMPKDSTRRLGSGAVRYLLHRLFVQRHGWLMHGLDATGDAWNSSSPASLVKEHAGEDIHSVFEDRLSKQGFDLHHTAVLAATLETFVHLENVERLKAAYGVLSLSPSETLVEAEVVEVIQAYMMMHVLNMNYSDVTEDQFHDAAASILDVYPAWPDTEVFVREVRQSVLADVVGDSRTTWDSTLKVLEEVGERYGRWQDKECRALKGALMEMEDEPGTGRVPVTRFYGGAYSKENWQFFESVPYLRQLGALDDSEPGRQLSVIIPNYINSPANRLASSKFYSVCCIDECEALLGALERSLAAPDAPPAAIAQLVGGMPSDTVRAPRSLPASLLERLESIATHHGGRVPLHGRLFAQWMHHAYPRECSYPHLSGTTKPLPAQAWMDHTGIEVLASEEEVRSIVDGTSPVAEKTSEGDSSLHWSSDEELFVCHAGVPSGQAEGPCWKSTGALVAIFSATLVIMRSYASADGEKGSALPLGHYV